MRKKHHLDLPKGKLSGKAGDHLLDQELRIRLQGENLGLEAVIEIIKEELVTENEEIGGGLGHSHALDQDQDLDLGLGIKVLHSLEMRGKVIHLDGKRDGEMTAGGVPGEMIDTGEVIKRNRMKILRRRRTIQKKAMMISVLQTSRGMIVQTG